MLTNNLDSIYDMPKDPNEAKAFYKCGIEYHKVQVEISKKLPSKLYHARMITLCQLRIKTLENEVKEIVS